MREISTIRVVRSAGPRSRPGPPAPRRQVLAGPSLVVASGWRVGGARQDDDGAPGRADVCVHPAADWLRGGRGGRWFAESSLCQILARPESLGAAGCYAHLLTYCLTSSRCACRIQDRIVPARRRSSRISLRELDHEQLAERRPEVRAGGEGAVGGGAAWPGPRGRCRARAEGGGWGSPRGSHRASTII